jgi:adenylylsulfate reductase subunit A
MDEYCGGVSAQFTTNKSLLERGLELMVMLKEDSVKMAAADLHELLRVWENTHRMWIAESHLRHVLFREESRWPGYYFRADFPDMDEKNWKCFVNSVYDPKTDQWTMKKVPIVNLPV